MQRIALVTAAALALLPQPAAARVYTGRPDPVLTAQIVRAGGGAQHFDGAHLLAALTGPGLAGEVRVLRNRHGAAAVAAFGPELTYAIRDVIRLGANEHVRFPAYVPPVNRRELVEAIWQAGRAQGGDWDVGIFLERLMSHPTHQQLMRDLDASAHIGPARNAVLHEMLSETMHDLARADGLERSGST